MNSIENKKLEEENNRKKKEEADRKHRQEEDEARDRMNADFMISSVVAVL